MFTFSAPALAESTDALMQLKLPMRIVTSAEDDYDGRAGALQARIQGHE